MTNLQGEGRANSTDFIPAVCQLVNAAGTDVAQTCIQVALAVLLFLQPQSKNICIWKKIAL